VGKGVRLRAVPTFLGHSPYAPLVSWGPAAPIPRQHSTSDIAVKAAMRPIANLKCMSVLHGIEVNIVDMALQIGIVANGMLPIATLPNSLSRRATLLKLRGMSPSSPRENPLLIRLQRSEKSASPLGSDQRVCKWSGNTQIAIVWKGWRS
jgi:hypothetical protein